MSKSKNESPFKTKTFSCTHFSIAKRIAPPVPNGELSWENEILMPLYNAFSSIAP